MNPAISQRKELIGDGKEKFAVAYITNAPATCINPTFPLIKVTIDQPISGWIQLIHVEFAEGTGNEILIDSKDKATPLYTAEAVFADAPFWTFPVIGKPTMEWKAHLYPVVRTDEGFFLGNGIIWGFKVHPYKLTPLMIEPHLGGESNLLTDIGYLKSKFTKIKFLSSLNKLQ